MMSFGGSHSFRGSGSSGYIQKNISGNTKSKGHYESRELDLKIQKWRENCRRREREQQQPNADMLRRQNLRNIEVMCAELEDELEEKGVPTSEIQDLVMQLKTRLMKQDDASESKDNNSEENKSLEGERPIYHYKSRFS